MADFKFEPPPLELSNIETLPQFAVMALRFMHSVGWQRFYERHPTETMVALAEKKHLYQTVGRYNTQTNLFTELELVCDDSQGGYISAGKLGVAYPHPMEEAVSGPQVLQEIAAWYKVMDLRWGTSTHIAHCHLLFGGYILNEQQHVYRFKEQHGDNEVMVTIFKSQETGEYYYIEFSDASHRLAAHLPEPPSTTLN